MKIKPLGKRVLIKQVEQEEVKEKPITGEVLAVGKDVEDVKTGDKVIFEKYSGTEVKDGDDTYLILDMDNVLGIVE